MDINELLNVIETGLQTGASESRAANSEWGFSFDKVDSDITDAIKALDTLRVMIAPQIGKETEIDERMTQCLPISKRN